MRRYALLLALLALLAGCGARAGVPLEVARRRWETNLIEHYQLHVEQQTGGASATCGQVTEVRLETFERLLSSTCADASPWTISSLFLYAAWMQADDGECMREVPGVGCVCRGDVEVRGDYDPSRGYPRELLIRYSWRANWQEQSYWRAAALAGALPDCTPPRGAFERRLVVKALTRL